MFTRSRMAHSGKLIVLSALLVAFGGVAESVGQPIRQRPERVRGGVKARTFQAQQFEQYQDQLAAFDKLIFTFDGPVMLSVRGQTGTSRTELASFAVEPVDGDPTEWVVASDRSSESMGVFDVIAVRDHILVFSRRDDGSTHALMLSLSGDSQLLDAVPFDDRFDFVATVVDIDGDLADWLKPTEQSAADFLEEVSSDVDGPLQAAEARSLAALTQLALPGITVDRNGDTHASAFVCCATVNGCVVVSGGCPHPSMEIACPCLKKD